METIFILLMVLIMIASVLLVIVIMAQNPKGGGLSSTFGGASSAQFGVQRTNDFMEKATWTLGAVIIVLILVSVVITGKPTAKVPALPTSKEAPASQGSAPAQSAPATQGAAPVQTAPVAPAK
ncbi:preprotein translocase subunit SecG [Chryseobacterium sp. Leaf394]|uniref:preprotein translocase subunit SecG n=1 Tax=Chryseobacterium sp. Leaf394 TaxID=1736361 RepID=UPI0006F79A80|nr:preprotein translocase subunit SecG [Chryseobacterium sp. Leaf394]KQS89388.1 preprotein translocase subunit SecG [Chryseobacterium sp. Leaf394]